MQKTDIVVSQQGPAFAIAENSGLRVLSFIVFLNVAAVIHSLGSPALSIMKARSGVTGSSFEFANAENCAA
jgi:hypothetical protein